MKKLLMVTSLVALLTGCGSETVKTVVVDQDGNVIDSGVESEYDLVFTGEYIKIKGSTDYPIYKHTTSGCEYFLTTYGMTPNFIEGSKVKGCKNN